MWAFKRLATWLAVVVVACAPQAAFGAAKDAVLNKEGYWGIDVDKGACVASMTLQGGSTFLLRAVEGRVTFGLFTRAPMARAKAGRIETEAYGVDFAPSYANDTTLFFRGDLDARALAALRLARQVRILGDGVPVAAMTFEGTGFEGALDGVIACSKGEKGWWGAGLARGAAKAPAPAQPVDKQVLNKEGIWRVGPEGDRCYASATLKNGDDFMLMAESGRLSFGLGSDHPARRGKRGSFQTEAYAFEFQPSYSKESVLFFDGDFNQNALAALRLAKDLRIVVDGREVMDAHVEGSGLDGVLDAVTACSTGKQGWWGAGAKLASAGSGGDGSADEGEARHAAGGSGSAFFISADGVAVTAAHVVKDCKQLESPRWGTVKLLAADPQADLAVLKTTSASGQFVALRIRGPRLGEPMSAAGYPLGQLLGSGLKITTGVVSGLAGPGGDRGLFQLSAPIQPGNSGGPVIDAGGALIGVTSAKLDELKVAEATGVFPQNVNFAVPVTVLQSFLEENGVAYKTAAAAGPASATVAPPSYTFSLVCSR